MAAAMLSATAYCQIMPDNTAQVCAYWTKGDSITYDCISKLEKTDRNCVLLGTIYYFALTKENSDFQSQSNPNSNRGRRQILHASGKLRGCLLIKPLSEAQPLHRRLFGVMQFGKIQRDN